MSHLSGLKKPLKQKEKIIRLPGLSAFRDIVSHINIPFVTHYFINTLFAKLTKRVMARVKKRFDIIFSHSRGTH